MSRPKADPKDPSHVGAPMAGVVVEVRVKESTEVKKGDPIAIMSAMKMVCNYYFYLQKLWYTNLGSRK